MEAVTYHLACGSQVLSPKYDMNAFMTTLLELRLGTYSESWVEQKTKNKLDPTLNTTPANIFSYNNQDPTLMIINYILMAY
jgi:hypothetical protein